MRYLIEYETFGGKVNGPYYSIKEEDLKNRFKVGEYAIMTAFNNMRVKIIEVTKDNTLWVENEEGYLAEWKPNGIIPEIEFQSKKYNL